MLRRFISLLSVSIIVVNLIVNDRLNSYGEAAEMCIRDSIGRELHGKLGDHTAVD